MENEFWHSRWREGRIGFHEGRTNVFLERHGGKLGTNKRVLVPLCGKSQDLAYLAGLGHEVVGVELVEQAVRAFFEEQGLTPDVEPRNAHRLYRAGNITIVVGDVLMVGHSEVGDVTALYDRAALIALPPPVRARYTHHLRSLLAPGSSGLVVTLEYPQEKMEGPPFSVPEAELRTHYAGLALQELETGAESESFRSQGIEARSRAWLVHF